MFWDDWIFVLLVLFFIPLFPIISTGIFGTPIQHRVNLTSVADGTQQFAVILGGSYEELSYFYYKQLPDGGHKLKSTEADDATVYEDAQTPYLVKKAKEFCGFSLPLGVKEIHVPKGSIKRGANMDLNGRMDD